MELDLTPGPVTVGLLFPETDPRTKTFRRSINKLTRKQGPLRIYPPMWFFERIKSQILKSNRNESWFAFYLPLIVEHEYYSREIRESIGFLIGKIGLRLSR